MKSRSSSAASDLCGLSRSWGLSSHNMCIWDFSAETEGDTNHCSKGWSAGGGQSLYRGDEGRINMKNRCLDAATKYRLKHVA